MEVERFKHRHGERWRDDRRVDLGEGRRRGRRLELNLEGELRKNRIIKERENRN
jgi:hypothetical protein